MTIIRRYFNDCTDSARIVVHHWMRRDPWSADRYVDGASRIHGDLPRVLDECAREQGRVLVGAMEYEFVPDLAALPGHVLSEVRSMRRREEWRPWRHHRLVLVRAWQPTQAANGLAEL